MAIITKPSVTKGTPAAFQLLVSQLEAHASVVAHPILNDPLNWKRVSLTYRSSEISQVTMVLFDVIDGVAQDGSFLVSTESLGDFIIESLNIMDAQGGFLSIPRSSLTPAEFDVIFIIILAGIGVSWGAGYTATVGDNTTTNRSAPVNVVGQSDFTAIALGSEHAVALKSNGTVFSWGTNTDGRLGHNTTSNTSSPVQVVGQSTFKMVAASKDFSALLKSDGTLWTMGGNAEGQLGLNNTTSVSSPVQVVGQSSFKSVACSAVNNSIFMMAIKSDGTLWGCGSNGFGQLGINNTSNQSSMVQVVGQSNFMKIGLGGDGSAFAIKSDGTLWACGFNQFYGALGLGDLVNRSSFVQVSGHSDFMQVASSRSSTYALKSDGTMWSVGLNSSGELALNNTTNRSTFAQVTGHSNFSKVVAGAYFVIALKSEGTVWSCGINSFYQLGLGNFADRSTFAQLSVTNAYDIGAGEFNGTALKTV